MAIPDVSAEQKTAFVENVRAIATLLGLQARDLAHQKGINGFTWPLVKQGKAKVTQDMMQPFVVSYGVTVPNLLRHYPEDSRIKHFYDVLTEHAMEVIGLDEAEKKAAEYALLHRQPSTQPDTTSPQKVAQKKALSSKSPAVATAGASQPVPVKEEKVMNSEDLYEADYRRVNMGKALATLVKKTEGHHTLTIAGTVIQKSDIQQLRDHSMIPSEDELKEFVDDIRAAGSYKNLESFIAAEDFVMDDENNGGEILESTAAVASEVQTHEPDDGVTAASADDSSTPVITTNDATDTSPVQPIAADEIDPDHLVLQRGNKDAKLEFADKAWFVAQKRGVTEEDIGLEVERPTFFLNLRHSGSGTVSMENLKDICALVKISPSALLEPGPLNEESLLDAIAAFDAGVATPESETVKAAEQSDVTSGDDATPTQGEGLESVEASHDAEPAVNSVTLGETGEELAAYLEESANDDATPTNVEAESTEEVPVVSASGGGSFFNGTASEVLPFDPGVEDGNELIEAATEQRHDDQDDLSGDQSPAPTSDDVSAGAHQGNGGWVSNLREKAGLSDDVPPIRIDADKGVQVNGADVAATDTDAPSQDDLKEMLHTQLCELIPSDQHYKLRWLVEAERGEMQLDVKDIDPHWEKRQAIKAAQAKIAQGQAEYVAALEALEEVDPASTQRYFTEMKPEERTPLTN